MAQDFPTRDILTVVTGVMLSDGGMVGVHALMEHVFETVLS